MVLKIKRNFTTDHSNLYLRYAHELDIKV